MPGVAGIPYLFLSAAVRLSMGCIKEDRLSVCRVSLANVYAGILGHIPH